MFLDDELKTILSENGFGTQTSIKLLKACVSRIPDPSKVSYKVYLDTLKQIDGSYRLFCKSDPRFNPDGFRNFILSRATGTSLKEYLHW